MFFKFILDLVRSIGYLVIFPFEFFYSVTVRLVKLLSGFLVKKRKRGRPKAKVKKIKFPRFLFRLHIGKRLHSFRTPKIKLPKIRIKKRINVRKLFTFRLLLLVLVSLAVLALFSMPVIKWFRELPNPDLLLVTSQNFGATKIYDRNGVLLYEIYTDKDYQPVKLDQMPPQAINATLSVEDSAFYHHKGIRVDSIFRSLNEILFKHNVQGGSTITQQLVKNVLLTPERTLQRKIKEAVLALMVEQRYTKNQILELYLNNIPYGGNSWGIQSAAQKYFGKNVWDLDLAESAMLAGLPSAPSAYSPITNFDIAKERQRYVLDRMVLQNYITQEDATMAYAEELVFVPQTDTIRAPHFVNYVRSLLEQHYGKKYVDTGGLAVYTTLDINLQDAVQKIVSEEVTKGARYDFTNGAAVVLDPKTGDILAYVGSADYFKPGWGAFDVVSALRQPGSSIKPVTYALALSKGYTPASIINDSPITYQFAGAKPYTPVNYDSRFHGNVTLRAALANSYNIPAVKLAAALGPDNIVGLGRELGLTNWQVDGSYGLSITLGGKEVKLIDLANVYATVARGGLYKDTNPILTIKDGTGVEIYSSQDATLGSKTQASSIDGLAVADTTSVTPSGYPRVLSAGVSYLLWNILSDDAARTPAFGPYSQLVIPGYKVAVKTGTTDNKKDNWTFGFTPSYVVGVWVGNNDGHTMNPRLASGVTGAAPIWNRVMKTILAGKPKEIMPMPNSVFVKKDDSCGKTEVFVKGSNVPLTLCPPKDKDKDKNKEDGHNK